MNLLSSKNTVDFLSQAAPRVWVQRMLKWMVLDRELDAYCDKVIAQPYSTVLNFIVELIDEANEISGPKMNAAISEHYSPEFASKLLGKEHSVRIDDEKNIVEGVDNVGLIDVGFFIYASALDWDAGTLELDWIDDKTLSSDLWFPYQDFAGSEFPDPTYEIFFEGLKFEARKIELLLPNASLKLENQSSSIAVNPRSIGRPQKWNWEGAMAHIISIAQHPDGLPIGDGAQAKIERLIADWFVTETGNSPAVSQIRQRARSIITLVEKD